MLKCSYIILIHNNQNTIPQLVDSLSKIKGNFSKEFIFIDCGSKDDSLKILKNQVGFLPRVTIIAQEGYFISVLVNQAIRLAQGDYVHFIEGNTVVLPDSTLKLLELCKNSGIEVAYSFDKGEVVNPTDKSVLIKEILENKNHSARNIGLSGTMVSLNLLEEIGGVDEEIYLHNLSLSLRCAKYTNFVYLEEATFIRLDSNFDTKFVNYNDLYAIYNFIKNNEAIYNDHISSFLFALSSSASNSKSQYLYLFQYFCAKYNKKYSFDRVLKSYFVELEKLF